MIPIELSNENLEKQLQRENLKITNRERIFYRENLPTIVGVVLFSLGWATPFYFFRSGHHFFVVEVERSNKFRVLTPTLRLAKALATPLVTFITCTYFYVQLLLFYPRYEHQIGETLEGEAEE